MTTPNVHVPHYPDYTSARAFLRLMDGRSRRTLASMRDSIYENVGTPQETRDWSQPEQWIPEILQGEERSLAEYLWQSSEGKVNPRHLTGLWLFCSSYELFMPDHQDKLHITSRGQDFLSEPLGEVVQQIDYSEGLLQLLAIVSEHSPSKRSDLLPHFAEFLAQYSRVRSQSAISSRWYDRISNLVERNLVTRQGVFYQISKDGLAYLDRVATLLKEGEDGTTTATKDLRRLLDTQQTEVRKSIAEALRNINPYQLEALVKTLLEAMGYVNVEVTSRSGDGGVDVQADIQVGITSIREVVQVKRHQGNIQRPILDMLRGSLHRFRANRGTIITTGKFSKGAQEAAFEPGAAPITLIDGDRLINLLIEHEIGARKESINVLYFSPEDFLEDAQEP